MLFKGTLIGAASGSISGTTFSHNRGGQYTRQRAIPVNPNTTPQQIVRSAMSSLSARWRDILTNAQRLAWNLYAENTPMPNAVGDPINVGGIGMYIRSNIIRVQAALAIIDAGPTTYGLPAMTLPGITSVTAATKIAIVTFTNTDSWANEVGGALLVWMSPGMPQSIGYYKGPFQFAGKVAGAATPPTSPANITGTFPQAAGNNVWIRFAAVRADGRVSADAILKSTAV